MLRQWRGRPFIFLYDELWPSEKCVVCETSAGYLTAFASLFSFNQVGPKKASALNLCFATSSTFLSHFKDTAHTQILKRLFILV